MKRTDAKRTDAKRTDAKRTDAKRTDAQSSDLVGQAGPAGVTSSLWAASQTTVVTEPMSPGESGGGQTDQAWNLGWPTVARNARAWGTWSTVSAATLSPVSNGITLAAGLAITSKAFIAPAMAQVGPPGPRGEEGLPGPRVNRVCRVRGVKRVCRVRGVKRVCRVRGVKRVCRVRGVKRVCRVRGVKRVCRVRGVKRVRRVRRVNRVCRAAG